MPSAIICIALISSILFLSYANTTSSAVCSGSNVTLTGSNIIFSKPGGLLVSGSASAVITGSTNNGKFNYTGTFTFTGNGYATLTLGKIVYLVNLVTGRYAPQQ